jgi:hypothetical protein
MNFPQNCRGCGEMDWIDLALFKVKQQFLFRGFKTSCYNTRRSVCQQLSRVGFHLLKSTRVFCWFLSHLHPHNRSVQRDSGSAGVLGPHNGATVASCSLVFKRPRFLSQPLLLTLKEKNLSIMATSYLKKVMVSTPETSCMSNIAQIMCSIIFN